MDYDQYRIPGLPLASEVNWDIRREGHAWGNEAHDRWELTPEKFEMWDGKIFSTHHQRLLMLGLLLENLGADAAVRLGDARVWREAIAAMVDHG